MKYLLLFVVLVLAAWGLLQAAGFAVDVFLSVLRVGVAIGAFLLVAWIVIRGLAAIGRWLS